MTEAEAKTKWCPMVRITLSEDYIAVNRDEAITDSESGSVRIPNTCIGSACMMWRDEPFHESRNGYCGLAGKP